MSPLIAYKDDGNGNAVFDTRCPKCRRFTTPPKTIAGYKCIAKCKRCGDVELEYDGQYSDEECGIKEKQ